MIEKSICRGHSLRIAFRITVLALLLAGTGAALAKSELPNIPIENASPGAFHLPERADAGIVQPKPGQLLSSTKHINDNATGGDCTSIGTWDSITKTCTLTTDLNETVQIDGNDITLNGGGYIVNGSGTGVGVDISGRTGVIIKNLNVKNFDFGIYLYYSSNGTLSGNNVSNTPEGIFLYSSSNNTLSGNNASNSSEGIRLESSSNNTLSGNNASNNYGTGIALERSSNNKLSGNNALNNYGGIFIPYSSNNTLSGNNANSNNYWGIYLYSSSNNMFSGNNANSNNYWGIYIDYSSNNMFSGNNANSNNYGTGIDLCYSSNNNTLSGNNVSNNYWGIYISSSSNSTLINNSMTGNYYNFGLGGNQNSYFDNTIDTSNTVDGKPIIYIKNGTNTVYNSSSNAGTIYCIWCNNVTIKDITVIKNVYGVFFWNTNDSKVENIDVSNNYDGIGLYYSSDNTLSGNNANSNNGYRGTGIYLYYSSNNTLSGNSASNNGNYGIGIYLYYSSNNTLSRNSASNNSYSGIYISSSSNNLIYDNIFNNTNNLNITGTNIWNTTWTPGTNIIGGPSVGGNFWATPDGSGFSQTCTDSNNDGICDSPYLLDGNNIDYLPLSNKSAYNSVSSCIDISSPGTYVLTADLSNLSTCINITSSYVTLDGAGHTINGTVAWDSSGVHAYNATKALTNVTVKNLKVINWAYGVYYQNIQNGSINNNTANSNIHNGIRLEYSGNNILSNNTVSSNNNYDGISLFTSNNNILINNTVDSNAQYGISLFISSENTLSNNKVSNNGYGIQLSFSSDNELSRNYIDSNNYFGILLEYSSNNTLRGNTANLTRSYDGISLSSSNDNRLSENTVSDNARSGLSLGSSDNNFIYNNYLNNTNNALDNGNNTWNITKTPGKNIIGGSYLGGNFWASPSGNGFSQTCIDDDNDEICDSTYTIDTNNIDYLPLTEFKPKIVIYTDKTSYKAGDAMHVGLNITNPGSTVNVGIYIWVDLPGGGKKYVKSYPSITLPAGLDWKYYPWMTITLPDIPSGNYAWHAVLKKNSSGNIISESISPWIFGSSASRGIESQKELEETLQGVPMEMDFTNEPE